MTVYFYMGNDVEYVIRMYDKEIRYYNNFMILSTNNQKIKEHFKFYKKVKIVGIDNLSIINELDKEIFIYISHFEIDNISIDLKLHDLYKFMRKGTRIIYEYANLPIEKIIKIKENFYDFYDSKKNLEIFSNSTFVEIIYSSSIKF
jgi:hypothetical protein